MKKEAQRKRFKPQEKITKLNFYQNINVPITELNLGNRDWCFSLLAQFDDEDDQYLLKINNSAGKGIFLGRDLPGMGGGVNIAYTNTTHNYIGLNNSTLGYLAHWDQRLIRFTMMRRGNNLMTFLNGRLCTNHTSITSGTLFDYGTLETFSLAGAPISDQLFSGRVGQFLFIEGATFTDREFENFHLTDQVPNRLHKYVRFQYEFNQPGEFAIDSSPKYNHAKTDTRQDGFESGDATIANPAPILTFGTDGDGDYAQIECVDPSTFEQVRAVVIPEILNGHRYNVEFRMKAIGGTTRLGIGVLFEWAQDVTLNEDELTTISDTFVGTDNNNRPFYMTYSVANSSTAGMIVRLYAVRCWNTTKGLTVPIRYSSNQILGSIHPATQTGLEDIYSKTVKGGRPFKFNGTDSFAQIGSYAPNPANWSLYIEAYFEGNISSGTFHAIVNCDDTNAQAGMLIMHQSGNRLRGYYNGENALEVSGRQGMNRVLYTHDGTNLRVYVEGELVTTLAEASLGFEFFRFGYNVAANPLYSGMGTQRIVFIDRVVSTRERGQLFNSALSDDYLNIPDTQFNLDFGQIITSGGNWYIKDMSGNNRSALLFNFVPMTDQPFNIGIGEGAAPSGAYKIDDSLEQRLTINDFVITEEEGFTYLIGMCLDQNRPFASGEVLFGEITAIKQMLGFGWYVAGMNDPAAISYYLKRTDIPFVLVMTETAGGTKRFYYDGALVYELESSPATEWDGTLKIGEFTGFLMKFAMWKGVLNEAEVKQVSSLYSNPKELVDRSEIYLTFDRIYPIGMDWTVQDYSPNSRTVNLNNLSPGATDPDGEDYGIWSIERVTNLAINTKVDLPSTVKAKTVGWWSAIDRRDLEVDVIDRLTLLRNKLGVSSYDFINETPGSNYGYRRLQPYGEKFPLARMIPSGTGTPSGSMQQATKNLDFLHNGSDFFIAFVYGHKTDPGNQTPWGIMLTSGNANNVDGIFLYHLSGYAGAEDLMAMSITSVAGNQGNVLRYAWRFPLDQLNTFVIVLDTTSGQASAYLNGSTTPLAADPGTSRNVTAAFGTGASAINPVIVEKEANSNQGGALPEMFVGDDTLTTGEIEDIFEFFNKKYGGTFPLPLPDYDS